MENRLTIDKIDKNSKGWSCKVQQVEKGRTRFSKDGTKSFVLLVLQDEKEQQVGAALYGDRIGKFGDRLHNFHTYVIRAATVRDLSAYSIPIYKYEWVLDQSTNISELKQSNIEDPPLPPPTKLNNLSLLKAHQLPVKVEFDMVVAVIDCGPIKFVGPSSRKCREVTVIDTELQPAMLTLWEDFAEIDGDKIAECLAGINSTEATQVEMATTEPEHPIILAKRVAHSTYAGSSFSTRYGSVILMDSPYSQVHELQNWARANRLLLQTFCHGGSHRTVSALQSSPQTVVMNHLPQHNIVAIATIHSESTTQFFIIEGEITVPDDQYFFTLACFNCGHQYRPSSTKMTECWECDSSADFEPKIKFEVDIIDATGTIRGIFQGQLAEDFLRMSADEIYDTVINRRQQLPLQRVNERLCHKLFRIQGKKPYSRSSNVKLYVNSCVEQQQEQAVVTELPAHEISHQLSIQGSGSPKRQQPELDDQPRKK